MTSEEFEEQKKDLSKRFYIDYVDCEKARRMGYYDPFYVVVDRTTGEQIGSDGGEPEDQLLVRDWSWVVDALNRFCR